MGGYPARLLASVLGTPFLFAAFIASRFRPRG
jgi:hypothetical protein